MIEITLKGKMEGKFDLSDEQLAPSELGRAAG
jgi:hypothetical protein